SAASHGSAISSAKRVKDSPLAWNASRLVRLETGNSSDALLARWVHAYTCGLGLARSRAAVANTIGVSSTIVASRLRTAVVQSAGLTPGAEGHRRAQRVEQTGTPAAVGEHQHRGQESHRRPQRAQGRARA